MTLWRTVTFILLWYRVLWYCALCYHTLAR